jgi:hypothetical protein
VHAISNPPLVSTQLSTLPKLTRHIASGALDRIAPTPHQRSNLLCVRIRSLSIGVSYDMSDGRTKVDILGRLWRDGDQRGWVGRHCEMLRSTPVE